MYIWINKEKKDDVLAPYNEGVIFNVLNKNNKSNVKSNVETIWRRFGEQGLATINEDLLIIAMSIFSIDKRVARKLFPDCWTRILNVCIPVIEFDKWNLVKKNLEIMLQFLTGDVWKIEFRKANTRYRGKKINTRYNVIQDKNFDGISLFSGGLDSYSGAIKLLEQGRNICFTGFREYGHLELRQQKLMNILKSEYSPQLINEIWFNTTPYAPKNIDNNNATVTIGKRTVDMPGENTSRSRSFLFLAGALGIASILGETTPVYIPENGFIGINVPLTDSRKGSCSTRTTHPFFVRKLNELLRVVGINNPVENFYAFMSKGEIVSEVAHTKAFIDGASDTISCSHPCQARYDHKPIPMNCGYCYPCIVRRASMNTILFGGDIYNKELAISMQFIQEHYKLASKGDDIKAVLWSLNRYINADSELSIKKLIMQTGELTNDEIEKAYRVYCKTMEEIKAMVEVEANHNGRELFDYVGIED